MRITGIAIAICLLTGAAARAAEPSLAAVPGVAWVVKVKKRGEIGRGLYQFSTPLIDGERVVIGSAGGRVVSIDRRRGERRWEFVTDGPVVAGIAAASAHLYFGDAKGIVYAVRAADGMAEWRQEVGGEVAGTPLVLDNVLYVTTAGGELIAIDRATGARKWRTSRRMTVAPFSVKGGSSPVMVEGRIVFGAPDGKILAVDAASGALAWEVQLAAPATAVHDVDTTPLRHGGLLIAAAADGPLVAFAPQNGRIAWRADLGTVNPLAIESGTLYLAGAGRVYALDAGTGRTRWQTRLPVDETSGPVIIGDRLLLLSPIDQAFVVDKATGTLLGKRHMGSGSYGHPVADGNDAYFITDAGSAVALRIPN
ncbi:MAG: PQQ-binding-like beta-propeller repeat protein [Deltaproteobacteria bacterium]|nr:PQQ-binding-like beta-propeller repeat protein [Deltaproteobacteria bacterium]